MNPKLHNKYPKSNRLCGQKNIKSVFSAGELWSFNGLKFKYIKKTKNFCTKTVISIPKKMGNAAYRNKIKRWLREALRKQNQNPAIDLAIFARPPVKLNWLAANQAVQKFFNFLV